MATRIEVFYKNGEQEVFHAEEPNEYEQSYWEERWCLVINERHKQVNINFDSIKKYTTQR